MQPVSMNTGMNYPVYANCFDRLTTNGVIAEDLVGYVTDTPSPYLQNYIAQKGGVPNMPYLPGQVLPDPLPAAPQPAPMAVPGGAAQAANAYSDIPKASDLNTNTFVKKDKYETAKKVAAGILLTGLAVLGAVKGRQLFKNGGAGLKASLSNAWNSVKTFCSNTAQKIGTWCKNAFNATVNFFKNLWNRIFHRTP